MAFDAADATTGVVEKMHRTVQVRPGPLGISSSEKTRGITGLVYRGVRAGIRLLGQTVDASLAALTTLAPEGESPPILDAYRSAANGVYGDYLLRSGNPLAIDMNLRFRNRPVDPADSKSILERLSDLESASKLLILVHGACMTDRHWNNGGHDHGAALADDLGFLPLYLRYNSGLPIESNGRAFAELLETLITNWTRPVQELVIMGHSMGGLVARSACQHARSAGHVWPEHLGKLVFLGTPHHGAPLERAGHGLELMMDLSPYSTPLTRLSRARSTGITDLRHGTVSAGQQNVPLPLGVKCYAAAAVRGTKLGVLSEKLVGDGLVPLDSALGRHCDVTRSLAIPNDHQWVGYGMGHQELMHHPDVYAQIRQWLEQPA